MIGYSSSAASPAALRTSMVIFLFIDASDFLDRGFAEQAGRLDGQHQQQQQQARYFLVAGGNVVTGGGFGDTQNQAADDGAHARRQAADNRHRKGFQTQRGAHGGARQGQGRHQHASESSRGRRQGVGKRDHPARIDAHQAGRVAVIGGGDDGLAIDRFAVEDLDG